MLIAISIISLFSYIKIPSQPSVKSASVITTISPITSPAVGHQTKTTGCVSQNGLPDKECTPGAVDPRVTQDNIHQTICVTGYTKTVRPPVAYTNSLKIQQISDYGYSDLNPADYEEDHLIPLELGGAPADPANLWPEPGIVPNSKDKIENLCHIKVCTNEISLSEAQYEIATDWQNACR